MMNKRGDLMIKKLSRLLFKSFILFCFTAALAGEYVPPPTGPYQSTVIINKGHNPTDNSGRVYKFPSADLIQQDSVNNSAVVDSEPSAKFKQETALPSITEPEKRINVNTSKPDRDLLPGNTASTYYAPNPWAPGGQPYPDTYQSYWGNPQYSYPQRHSSGYNNQNDFMNGVFTGMPAPWSSMPMQPFFSGR